MKQGDIVVRDKAPYNRELFEGGIYKIQKVISYHRLSDTIPDAVKLFEVDTQYCWIEKLRLATIEEIEAYNQGIRNINNIVRKANINDIINTDSLVIIKNIEELNKFYSYFPIIEHNSYQKSLVDNELTVIYLTEIKKHINWDKYSSIKGEYHKLTKQYKFEDIIFEPKFILPKKWVIRITSESKEEIYKFRYSKNKPPLHERHNYTAIDQDGWAGYVETTDIEITFEQFKKYILKEGINIIIKEEPKIELPKIKILGKKVKFIGKSIQFGNITISQKDLEAIERVKQLCSEQDLSIEFSGGNLVYVNQEESNQEEISSQLKEINKQICYSQEKKK